MNKNEHKKVSSVGGQALLEGVMMKSPTGIAMAVRKPDGEITTKYDEYSPPSTKNKFFALPIVRGCVNFVESLQLGMSSMAFAADQIGIEEEEPSRFELWLCKTFNVKVEKIITTIATFVAILFSAGLFIALPSFISSMVGRNFNNVVLTNIIEGVTRITIFLIYMVAISLIKDIKRLYMYHGAEHKTIACYEKGLELTPENAQTCSRFHARCGTNYLFLVMMVSIVFFSLLGFNGHWALKIVLRLACLPLVTGLSYEVLKAAASNDSLFARIVRYPGIQLQKLTTKEPDEKMLEVAITAFKLALHGER